MKIKKELFNKELRSTVTPFSLLSKVSSKNWGIHLMNFSSKFSNGKKIDGLYNEERFIPSKNNGPDIRVRIYKPLNVKDKLPIMLYNHGGGYLFGSVEMFNDVIKQFIEKRPCIVIAPDYRKALEAPYPAAFNDCYDTLLWAKENAAEIGGNDDKFMIAGHSAGGGLTAAVTLKARDTGDVMVAFQMPFYPMLDDRQNTQSAIEMTSTPAWNSVTNKKGWDSYLKDIRNEGKETPTYAAPARNTDYTNFPPTITFVGNLEPFKDETIIYADALKKEGIEVRFKLYEGCYHGFEIFAPKALISKDAVKFTYDSYAEFYDRYLE